MSSPIPPVFRLVTGDRPLLVSIPHAGRYVPQQMRAAFADPTSALPDTDHFVDRLYAFAEALGVSVLTASWSRWVIDLNRPSDNTPLYPGQSGTGLVPHTRFDGAPIWQPRHTPNEDEVAQRCAQAWHPYHSALQAELERLRARFGHVVLWDAHSIRSQVPRLFEGRLPDLNLGTFAGRSCAPALREGVTECLAAAPQWSYVVDGRFKGGHITRHYGRPEAGIHALQMELSQRTYLDEDTLPAVWNAERAAPMQELLRTIVETAAAWRP